MANNIHGLDYNKAQTEYQYFPEEYFSGSDVTIYFGDLFTEDVMGLNFTLEERVLPIFGYNSFTHDAVARGQRIVQGSFSIAFKEAGYLHRMLDHIGQLKHAAKPMIAFQLGAQGGQPKWLGGVNETIEDLLNRRDGIAPTRQTLKNAPAWPVMSLGSKNASVSQLQEYLLADSALRVTASSLTMNMRRESASGFTNRGQEVRILKSRLDEFLGTALDTRSAVFDSATEQAVKSFQSTFSNVLSVDGIVGPQTREYINRALTVSGTYDAATKLAVMKLQRMRDLEADGSFGPLTLATLKISVEVPNVDKNVAAESDYAAYEANVWAGTSKFDSSYKDGPHFYANDKQEWLQQEGFDIFINYGQLPQVTVQNGKPTAYLTHSNTVRALRNIQLTGLQQAIGPTGEAIIETYTFIAKDID